ncbi:hypothetical protein [Lacticaseibacillus kribbianus]|uniref:hypothetical protein n=1 Tax=Lacticaseibacillus kribbianus TaxID=2926292 RepID=UPI001CD2730C|nr:hypothetical protein [Lacticaseibacillus kribbianus]
MTNDETEAQLDALQNGMTEADRGWFGRVRLEMQVMGWTRNRAAVLAQLVAMAQDLRDAEAAGGTAAEYFGQDPRGMVKAILRELSPLPWPTFLRGGLSVCGLGWLIVVIGAAGRQPGLALHLVAVAGVVAATALAMSLTARWTVAIAFAKRPGWWGWLAALAALWAAWAAVTIALAVGQPGPAISVPAPWDWGLIAVSFVAAFAWVARWTVRARAVGVMVPTLLMLALFAANALVRQYYQDSGTSMTQAQAGWLVAIMVPLVLGYFVWSAWLIVHQRRAGKHR